MGKAAHSSNQRTNWSRCLECNFDGLKGSVTPEEIIKKMEEPRQASWPDLGKNPYTLFGTGLDEEEDDGEARVEDGDVVPPEDEADFDVDGEQSDSVANVESPADTSLNALEPVSMNDSPAEEALLSDANQDEAKESGQKLQSGASEQEAAEGVAEVKAFAEPPGRERSTAGSSGEGAPHQHGSAAEQHALATRTADHDGEQAPGAPA